MRIAHEGAWSAVVVTPAPGDPARLAQPRADCALIMVVSLGPRREMPAGRLGEIFGLTSAESDLATKLLDGERPEDIAEARGVRISTIRSQIRGILGKTGTTRQAEVAELLGRIPRYP